MCGGRIERSPVAAKEFCRRRYRIDRHCETTVDKSPPPPLHLMGGRKLTWPTGLNYCLNDSGVEDRWQASEMILHVEMILS